MICHSRLQFYNHHNSQFISYLLFVGKQRENITKKCSVRLFPLDLDVKNILKMEDAEKSFKDNQKRDNESLNDGPVLKKHKNDDIVVSNNDVTVIKVKSAGGPSKEGINPNKDKKAYPMSDQCASDGKSKTASLQRTGSFDSSRKSEKESKVPKSSSAAAAAASSCTLDKTDRTSLNCLEQKLLELQKATQKTKSSGEILSTKPKSMSPSGIKPSKDSHHRRKEDFITERKKFNSSPKKLLKKSTSLPAVKENKIGNLFCPTTDAKVTILPINKPSPKDLEHKPANTSNSVTITKISSGDSLNVPSKDIKKVFSPKSKTSPDSAKGQNKQFPSKNFSKNEKHRSLEKHKEHKHRDKEHRSRESSRESRDGKERGGECQKHNCCSKCNEQFSTKEAKKLHTCNSILDAHYLIDERDRQKTSPTSSVSASESSSTSLSRSSSRSSSPGIPGAGVSNKKSNNDTPPKLKLSVNKSDTSDKVKFSLKKDESDEKVKKPSTFGMKRDSPKEKWVESNKSFKSENVGGHFSPKDSHRDSDELSKVRTSGIVIEPVKLNYKNSDDKQHLGKSTGDECRTREDLLFSGRVEHDFTFSGKRTYSPSMGEAASGDGKGKNKKKHLQIYTTFII